MSETDDNSSWSGTHPDLSKELVVWLVKYQMLYIIKRNIIAKI